jgi:sarcosine oxidase
LLETYKPQGAAYDPDGRDEAIRQHQREKVKNVRRDRGGPRGNGERRCLPARSRGKKVLGLEKHTPAHDKGSSHGKSRIIRQAYYKDPAYVPLLLSAYELWERLEGETGEELMTLTGGLMIGRLESELVSGSVWSAKAHGLPHEMLDEADIKRRFPALAPSPGTVALFEKKGGFVRPEAIVKAHLDRAGSLGADLRFEEPVVSWEASSSGDRVRVQTSKANYEAERLVIAPGAWAPRLLADLRVKTRNRLFCTASARCLRSMWGVTADRACGPSRRIFEYER